MPKWIPTLRFFSFGFFVVIFWKFEKRSENGSNGAIIIIKQKWAIRIIKKILPVLEWRIVLLPPHPDPSPIYSLITDNDDSARATTYPAKPKIGHSCCTTITLSYTSCRTLVFVNKKQSLIKKNMTFFTADSGSRSRTCVGGCGTNISKHSAKNQWKLIYFQVSNIVIRVWLWDTLHHFLL